VQQFISELKHATTSELLYDHISKMLYSSDASMYQIEPLAVFIPRSKNDLVKATELAYMYQIPIIARGAATNVTGAALGKGLIIDCAKHLNRIVEIHYAKRYAIVQPGVVLDHLNDLLAPHSLRVGPDNSASNRATIGGMVATNASGASFLQFGKMQDAVVEIELLMYNGELLRFSKIPRRELKEKLTKKGIEGKIYRSLDRIRKTTINEIQKRFPKLSKRVSGYNLDELIHEDHLDIAKLICGSEGTLGIITEIKLSLVPTPKHTSLVVLGFSDTIQGLKKIPELLECRPAALELIDDKIIDLGKIHPVMRSKLNWLHASQETKALFILEFDSESDERVQSQCAEVEIISQFWPHRTLCETIQDSTEQKHVWQLRKQGLGLLLSKRSYSKPCAFVEDVAVSIKDLPHFVQDLYELLKTYKKEAGFFGHVGTGCLHFRPYFDMKSTSELSDMKNMMQEVLLLVKKYHGALSGEHGDGLVRSWTSEKMFTKPLLQAFEEVKLAFDPYNMMNPGKIVGVKGEKPQGLLDNLKLAPDMPTRKIDTFYDFSPEGGIELSVDMCNGNGACRKMEGTMCPSFQVTHDERDTTRARAFLLQDILHGKKGEKEIFDEGFSKVMDLCIQCKGCKTECPSQVDMAKLKSEFLYHYHQKKKHTFLQWAFAHLDSILTAVSRFSCVVRLFQNSYLVKKWLKRKGIAEDRALPKLAYKRFSSQQERIVSLSNEKQNVVLFVDTFTEFFYPELAQVAVTVLQALDFHVIIPEWSCCGRTYLTKGFLPQAQKKLQVLVDRLYTYAKDDIPIIGLEPSCLLTLVDEAKALHLDSEKTEKVSAQCVLIDEFLYCYSDEVHTLCTPYQGNILIHGHCHQKALRGMKQQLHLLRGLVTGSVSEIPSGCCGMAGSFGYEQEHAAFSKKIAELVLAPAIRQAKADTVIITSGISCRTQITDTTNVKALHPVEFIAKQLKSNR